MLSDSTPLTGYIDDSDQSVDGYIEQEQEIEGTLDGSLIRGYSAYEIAVRDGFSGTEHEWLESLKGETGDIGPQGPRGETGPQGIQGIQGEIGQQGPKGETGQRGERGPQGIQGIQGPKGDTGATGPQGPIGFSDYATEDKTGVVRTMAAGGTIMATGGRLTTNRATLSEVKAGSQLYKPIVPANQHQSVFYGLAKAAGDSTQASSDNLVGTYTDSAKRAIMRMLGIDNLIATNESDRIANREYNVGDLFLSDARLYRTTVTIPAGGSILPGTNCVETKLADEIVTRTYLESVIQELME